MPLIACPACDEDEELRGRTTASGGTRLTCESCGHSWVRDPNKRCGLCGSDDLEAVATQTLEAAGRGEQRTPDGIREAWRCWSCGGRDVTSGHPVPAEEGWLEAAREEARRLRRRR